MESLLVSAVTTVPLRKEEAIKGPLNRPRFFCFPGQLFAACLKRRGSCRSSVFESRLARPKFGLHFCAHLNFPIFQDDLGLP